MSIHTYSQVYCHFTHVVHTQHTKVMSQLVKTKKEKVMTSKIHKPQHPTHGPTQGKCKVQTTICLIAKYSTTRQIQAPRPTQFSTTFKDLNLGSSIRVSILCTYYESQACQNCRKDLMTLTTSTCKVVLKDDKFNIKCIQSIKSINSLSNFSFQS